MDEPGGMMAAGPDFEQDVAVEAIWKLAVGVCIGENCYRAFISRERFDEHIAPLLKASIPPAVWSREKPKVAGWYWWRPNEHGEAFIVHLGFTNRDIVDMDDPEVLCTDYCEDQETPEELGGEFSSPLRPPVEGKG